jgi:SAM-dependent methyltransferase
VRPPLTLNAWLRYDIVRRLLASWSRPSSVLEIGVGQGAVGARLAELAPYTGVEPDATSRRAAEHVLPNTTRLVADLDELDGASRFGLVCAFEVLEHIDDDAAALRRWTEHVEPGGHLLVSTPAQSHRLGPFDERVGHLRRYDPPAIAALARGAGLHDVEVRLCGFPLGYALEAARNLSARRSERNADWRDQSAADRTAGSARVMQPPRWAGATTQLATAPFRWVQRPFERGRLGTGLVLAARRPA